MESDDLVSLINSGASLLQVMQELGLNILSNAELTKRDKYVNRSDLAVSFRAAVAEESKTIWRPDGSFATAMSDELRGQFRRVSPTPALATAKTLEGLALGAGRLFFLHASTVVALGRGHVVPLPARWLGASATTPNPATTHSDRLLESDVGAVLWESTWNVELDYSFRDRLDQVCAPLVSDDAGQVSARGAARVMRSLPRIATVHPWDESEMADPEEMVAGRFFGAYPAAPSGSVNGEQSAVADEAGDGGRNSQPDDRAVYELLAAFGKQAAVAVLPEVCLRSPDGMGDFIAERFAELPALIVAGSAHFADPTDGARSNTSQSYLDGVPLLRVAKRVPYVLRTPAGESFAEDIAPVSNVLRLAAGTATRLAVIICADVNSTAFMSVLQAAAVNMLLSPSWTPLLGTAGAALTGLAAYCQCVGVVANTPMHNALSASTGQTPIWACTAGPYDGGSHQLHRSDDPPPVAGILNPNVAPSAPEYWQWVPLTHSGSGGERF